jgi:phosphatidate phosphatase APP1
LACSGSSRRIQPDETVLFFPTAATFDVSTGRWRVPVHGWIFEREEGSTKRKLLLRALKLPADELVDGAAEDVFEERARLFLVDNEGGKRVTVEVAGERFELGPSEENGHFRGEVTTAGEPGEWVGFRAVTPRGDPRVFEGRAQLVAAEGLSVVSDLDDTIKVTEVLNRRRLIERTFFRDFEAVPGMAAVYTAWACGGAAFHYVSASPWQLYPPLSDFLDSAGFPRGTFHARSFRLHDSSSLDFFAAPGRYKVETLDELIRTFSSRHFVLVGDSGEADPEVYGEVARLHPGRVDRIFIRRVPGAENGEARFATAFADLPEGLWIVFEDAAELAGLSLPP